MDPPKPSRWSYHVEDNFSDEIKTTSTTFDFPEWPPPLCFHCGASAVGDISNQYGQPRKIATPRPPESSLTNRSLRPIYLETRMTGKLGPQEGRYSPKAATLSHDKKEQKKMWPEDHPMDPFNHWVITVDKGEAETAHELQVGKSQKVLYVRGKLTPQVKDYRVSRKLVGYTRFTEDEIAHYDECLA